ncbi:MAG: hypothetical protein ACKOTD_13500, partial [Phycisphaerales bacterium]
MPSRLEHRGDAHEPRARGAIERADEGGVERRIEAGCLACGVFGEAAEAVILPRAHHVERAMAPDVRASLGTAVQPGQAPREVVQMAIGHAPRG